MKFLPGRDSPIIFRTEIPAAQVLKRNQEVESCIYSEENVTTSKYLRGGAENLIINSP